jgi:hypothetical protein
VASFGVRLSGLTTSGRPLTTPAAVYRRLVTDSTSRCGVADNQTTTAHGCYRKRLVSALHTTD